DARPAGTTDYRGFNVGDDGPFAIDPVSCFKAEITVCQYWNFPEKTRSIFAGFHFRGQVGSGGNVFSRGAAGPGELAKVGNTIAIGIRRGIRVIFTEKGLRPCRVQFRGRRRLVFGDLERLENHAAVDGGSKPD